MKYKRNCIVSTRTDIRLLAGFARFYKNRNELARTKSSLVGDLIEDFARFLEAKELLEVPITIVEAVEILKDCNFNFLKGRGGIQQRSVVKDLANEEYQHVSSEMESIDSKISEKVGKDIAG